MESKDYKYYTPEIEEFHAGFEYEYFTKNWVNNKYQLTWCKLKFNKDEDFNVSIDDTAYFIETNQIRVKYLDDEDVISLGFNQITHDCFNLDVPLYRGREKQEVRLIIRQTVLIYLAQDEKYKDTDTTNLFTGTIKNKSELKRLLKQLQIL